MTGGDDSEENGPRDRGRIEEKEKEYRPVSVEDRDETVVSVRGMNRSFSTETQVLN